jgi:hypothetical protein
MKTKFEGDITKVLKAFRLKPESTLEELIYTTKVDERRILTVIQAPRYYYGYSVIKEGNTYKWSNVPKDLI